MREVVVEKKGLILASYSSNSSTSIDQNIQQANVSDFKESYIIDNEDKEEDLPAETAMWKSVILQSLIDVASNSKRSEDKLAKTKALNWLSIDSDDFVTVCYYASLDPEWVLKKLITL